MKNTIGLLLLGLLFQYGSADVSHLAKHGNNQYLPPPIQNLPVEQDYNGLDSQPNSGYLSPHNGNHGYLPPNQDQHQQQNDNGHVHHQHRDHHHDHHDHQHDHHQVHHHNNPQYEDSYDPSVQVSYQNDYAINHPHDHVHDQSHSGHTHNGDHDDHVEIDQQQLEPVFPSSFPIEAYVSPTTGPQINTHNGHNHVHPTAGPSRGESHSISLVHYHHNPVSVSSPAPFSLPKGAPTPLTPVTSQHNGYHYLPPAQPTDALYRNHGTGAADHSNHGGPGIVGGHHHTYHGPENGYLPPSQSHSNGVSSGEHSNHGQVGNTQQSSLVRPGGSIQQHHETSQEYLQPNNVNTVVDSQTNHVNEHLEQQSYLPPAQSNIVHHHTGHPHQEQNQDYASPNQLNPESLVSQSNYVSPAVSVTHGHSGGIHQAPQQGYLPPSHLNHVSPSALPFLNHHSHNEPQQEYLPPTQSNNQHHSGHQVAQQDYLPPAQSNYVQPGEQHHSEGQAPHQDYLPPTQSNYVHPDHHHSGQQVLQQEYLPPSQSNLGNPTLTSHESHLNNGFTNIHDHSGQTQQEYLPPTQSTYAHPGGTNEHHHSGHQVPQQDYLPPTQSTYANPIAANEHHHPGHQVTQQGYLPPTHSNYVHPGGASEHYQPGPQVAPQGYLPPAQSHYEHQVPQQDYLNPTQSNYVHPLSANELHHHEHQVPQQDYLPPTQSNYAQPGGANEHHHAGHQLTPQGYLPPTQSNYAIIQHQNPEHQVDQPDYLTPTHATLGNTGITNVHDHSGHSNQEPQQDYLPPNNALDLPDSSGAIHIVPPPHLGSTQNTIPQPEEPSSQLTVRGHVNVPLPIPQVGYFFVPAVVTRIPSLSEAKTAGLRPALNIPAIVSPLQPAIGPTQHISSPEYSRTFLLQKSNHPAGHGSTISITPSIETSQYGRSQDYLPPNKNSVQNGQDHHHTTVSNSPLGYLPPPQTNLQTLVSYPQQNAAELHPGRQQAQENLEQEYISPDNLSNRGLSLQNIARSEISGVNNPQFSSTNFQGAGYLPPPRNEHNSHQLNQDPSRSNLSPSQPENLNEITSLQTYMDGVHPNDRYGSSQYHHPPPSEKGHPPPPAVISPPMYSKPSAIRAYAPGMAYKVSTNTPFTTFTPAAYLPPVGNALSYEDDNDRETSIGFQLNEEAKRNLAKIMPKDNTIFPLEELFNLQGDDIDVPQLMEQLRGRIRTVQIINNQANSVKNIKVLETADETGVKTIKILGHSSEDPMGEHKIVRIISKGPHPQGVLQTVKIFSDHKEVSLPTQNAYLPPPKAKETYIRVLRHSQEAH